MSVKFCNFNILLLHFSDVFNLKWKKNVAIKQYPKRGQSETLVRNRKKKQKQRKRKKGKRKRLQAEEEGKKKKAAA